MNVINKLKSKKNKQSSSQVSQLPFQQPSQELSNKSVTTSIPPKPLAQIRTHSNFTQKSSFEEQDHDDININAYYQRKTKQQQMLNRMQKSDTFNQQELKQKHFSLQVRKSCNIADISVFQGQLIERNEGKQISSKKVKLSCGIQTIQFPQSIGKIILKTVIMLTQDEGIFTGDDILKIAEKKFKKK